LNRHVGGCRAVRANDQAALRGLTAQRGCQVVGAGRHLGEKKNGPCVVVVTSVLPCASLSSTFNECAAGPRERRAQVEVGGRCAKRIGRVTPAAAGDEGVSFNQAIAPVPAATIASGSPACERTAARPLRARSRRALFERHKDHCNDPTTYTLGSPESVGFAITLLN